MQGGTAQSVSYVISLCFLLCIDVARCGVMYDLYTLYGHSIWKSFLKNANSIFLCIPQFQKLMPNVLKHLASVIFFSSTPDIVFRIFTRFNQAYLVSYFSQYKTKSVDPGSDKNVPGTFFKTMVVMDVAQLCH